MGEVEQRVGPVVFRLIALDAADQAKARTERSPSNVLMRDDYRMWRVQLQYILLAMLPVDPRESHGGGVESALTT